MRLALGRARADGGPRDEIGEVLGDDRVEHFRRGRDTQIREAQEELASDPQSGADVVAPVEKRVVDEPLPADARPRLLEVHPHHEQEFGLVAFLQHEQALGVLDGCLRIVDRTRPDDDEQPRVAAVQDTADLLARPVHELGCAGGDGQIALQPVRAS